jgi:phospholipase C
MIVRVVLGLLTIAVMSLVFGRGAQPAAAATAGPCGARLSQAPAITHVILIIEENTPYSTAMQLPYVSSLASRCGVATNYHGVTHPSLGNYIALTSGVVPDSIRGRDCSPAPSCRSLSRSLFGQTAGSWRVWAESMPSRCSTATTSLYAVRHTAAPYYYRMRGSCPANQVQFADPARGLPHALSTGTLPRFGLIVPNLVHDMHEGCRTCGDNWLKTWLPRITASAPYRNGSTAILVTWDEANAPGNHVPLLVVSPYTRPGTRVASPYAHYALLRAMEDALRVGHLNLAGVAHPGLARAFRLR